MSAHQRVQGSPPVILRQHAAITLLLLAPGFVTGADEVPRPSDVEGQPLAANVRRVLKTLTHLGNPLDEATERTLSTAAEARDAVALQKALDPRVLFVVSINPEQRVKVDRGPAAAILSQDGYRPVLVKVLNEAGSAEALHITSPSAGALYAGEAQNSLVRQQQTELGTAADEADARERRERFLDLEVFDRSPMTRKLSGLSVEYVVALVASSESGRREATIGFHIGQGTQDIGFRGEVPILFDVRSAVPVRLDVRDVDGSPTTAKLLVHDAAEHVHPPQPKRLAPDFFFQPHVYRRHGEELHLPAGRYTVRASRGPEYREIVGELTVPDDPKRGTSYSVELERWVNPRDHGYFCGDHHIHGAGCAHYQSPTQGVGPGDMFRQVKGEGLNVGCVLTWGPCFDFQRRYFGPRADAVSEPTTLLKYDLEISGFGSAPLGHVCLLNLSDQTYPGTDGTTDGWPTWTVPVMRWAKLQGGVTGYPHSDMRIDPEGAASWLVERHDGSKDGSLSINEAEDALLPEAFARIDRDENRQLSPAELAESCGRAGDVLPNLVPPGMTGAGAMEIFVSVPEGACDFISAMDTGRVGEWNTWYHLLNCGFPLKVSGETDFPCMSSRRVGQGRVYVHMGEIETLDFGEWCRNLARGRSYVSDGYAHALSFEVDGRSPGFDPVELVEPGRVRVRATVAFAEELPRAVAHGTRDAPLRRDLGDTRVLHATRTDERIRPGTRSVELVVNGRVVARRDVPADAKPHELNFEIPIERSSWVALRQFPQLHTNPVNVLVGGKPIRASRESAEWCEQAVDLLWRNRSRFIAESERSAAEAAYDRARAAYRRIAAECD